MSSRQGAKNAKFGINLLCSLCVLAGDTPFDAADSALGRVVLCSG
jgi:hypothetical protein